MKTVARKSKLKKTTLTIKTDRVVKEEAQELAAELGLTVSAVVTALLHEFVERGSIKFEKQYRMTPYLESIIEEAEADFRAGKNVSGPLSTREEIEAYLRTPDES